MSTNDLTLKKAGCRAILIAAVMMLIIVFSAVSVHAAAGASIDSPKASYVGETGKKVTIKAKSGYDSPAGAALKNNYIYFKVSLNETTVLYDSLNYSFLNIISKEKDFTPQDEGEYLIEVCRDLTYVDGEHVDLAEEDFFAEDSVRIKVQKDISKAETVVENIPDKVYTGSPLTQEPVVTVDGKTLDPATDYDVSYSNNITDTGTVTMTITGKGFYKNSVTRQYQITPADISPASISGLNDMDYTGGDLTQTPVVTWNDRVLDPAADYDVSFADNRNVGTAKVIITGKNNFTGEAQKTFKIRQASIRNASLGGLKDKVFSGSPLTQSLTLSYQGKTLVKDTDYTLTYKDNIDPGTATVTIKGIGNFKDSLIRTFMISEPSGSSGRDAYIIEPENDAEFQVGSTITVKASAGIFMPVYDGGLPIEGAPNWIYIKITRNGEKVDYQHLPFYSTSDVVQLPFTAEKTGDYIIQTCYQSYVFDKINNGDGTFTLKLREIPYENFSPDDSVTVHVGTSAPTVKKDISTAEISGLVDKEYTGDAITQKPVVKLEGKKLTEGTDYYVTYNVGSANVEVGPVIVTVHGKGNYTGVANTHFNIVPKQITEDMITLSPGSFEYNGNLQKPDVTLMHGSMLMSSSTDYTLTNEGGTEPGSYEVSVTGKKNYTGTATKSYTINKWSIKNAVITADPAEFTYDGQAKEPNVSAKLGDAVLPADVYTVNYTDNVNAGTAEISIKAKEDSHYTGTAKGSFTIKPVNIGSSAVTVAAIADTIYDRAAHTPVPDITFGEQVLENNKDFTLSYENNTNSGKAAVIITGKGNFTGMKTVNFNIEPKDLGNKSIKVDPIPDQRYHKDTPATPEVIVHDGDALLTSDDFSVKYSNNETAGTAFVALTGKGNYTGTINDISFQIVKESIENATVSIEPASFVYDGSKKEPAVSVTLGNEQLAADQYTVTYDNNINVGSAQVTITAAENGEYSGSTTSSFRIEPMDINSDRIYVGAIGDLKYNRTAQTPVPEILIGRDPLSAGTDFWMSYENNTNAGPATATITGRGNFTGSRSLDFKILPKDLSDGSITVDPIPVQLFNNWIAVTPAVTVWDGDAALSKDEIKVRYINNKDPGTASVKITGKGNYQGTIEGITFEILERSDYAVAALENKITEIEAVIGMYLKDDQEALRGAISDAKDLLAYQYSTTDELEEALATLNDLQAAAIANIMQPLDDADILIDPASFVYDGTAKKPAVSVSIDGAPVDARQYIVEYKNNVNAGTANVIVTAREGSFYYGSVSGKFTIEPADISSDSVLVDAIYDQVYNRKAHTPVPGIMFNGQVLAEGKDFTISYDKNTNAGTAALTITGKGNFKEKRSASFNIMQKNISDGSVSVDPIPDQVYDNNTPSAPTLTVRDGKAVLNSDEISVSYSNNNEPGTAYAEVRGKGNYTGSITNIPFNILEKADYLKAELDVYISELEAKLNKYLAADQKAIKAAIKEAKALIADDSTTSEQLEHAMLALDELDKKAGTNLKKAVEAASSLPAAKATEKSILAQKTDKDPAGSSFKTLRLRSTKQSKKYNVIKWQKVPGASYYVIYGNKCGKKNRIKKIATVKSNTYKHKKLKKGTYYKYVVVAVKNTVAGERTAAISKMIHVSTAGSKYGNFKSVSVSKKVLSKAKKMKKGKTLKLGAKAKKSKSKARVHVGLRYQSSNKKIATVSKKGTVKALKKGSCTIYIYTQNGVYKKVTVKVVK